jgi:hypothetical protein
MRLFELMNVITPSEAKGDKQPIAEQTCVERIIKPASAVLTAPQIEQLFQAFRD